MDVQFNCPICGQQLVASAEYAGGKVECPACGGTATIPGGGAAALAASPADVFSGMALSGPQLPPGELTWTSLIRPAFSVTMANLGSVVGPIMTIGLLQSIIGIIPYLGSIAQLLVTGPLMLSIAIISLRVVRGEETGMSDVFSGFGYFGQALGAYFLMGLIAAGAGMVLILPAMVFPAWIYAVPFLMIPLAILLVGWSLTYWIIYDEDLGPWAAMRESWEMLRGHKGTLFGMMVLLGLINALGALCLLVGLLITMPMGYVAMAMFYEKLRRSGDTYSMAQDSAA